MPGIPGFRDPGINSLDVISGLTQKIFNTRLLIYLLTSGLITYFPTSGLFPVYLFTHLFTYLF